MTKLDDLKETLSRDLSQLAQTRDELLVQLSLAKAEARDEWKVLEERWTRLQGEIKRTASESGDNIAGIREPVRALLDDLKVGYERIKTQLKQTPGDN